MFVFHRVIAHCTLNECREVFLRLPRLFRALREAVLAFPGSCELERQFQDGNVHGDVIAKD
jgi:hypothetical protein